MRLIMDPLQYKLGTILTKLSNPLHVLKYTLKSHGMLHTCHKHRRPFWHMSLAHFVIHLFSVIAFLPDPESAGIVLGKHGKKYYIRKTCLCNKYPLKAHFYIVKLGYAGVYLFFLFLLQNIDCGYSLEPPLTIYVLSKSKKNIKIFLMELSAFTTEKNICILHGKVFIMIYSTI